MIYSTRASEHEVLEERISLLESDLTIAEEANWNLYEKNLQIRLVALEMMVELYELTPNKDQYDIRTDSFKKRGDLVTSIKTNHILLSQELKAFQASKP